MTMVAEPAVVGVTHPRIATAPIVTGKPGPCGCGCALTPRTSYGFDVDDFARDVLRMELDPWQRHLVIHAGELLPDGRTPRFRTVLSMVSRQNGKTTLLVVLTLYWLYVEQVGVVLGTSTTLKTVREAWKKAGKSIEETPSLKAGLKAIRHTNGEEEIETVWGSRYLITASNSAGGRGFTVNRLIIDEFREHYDWDAYNASEPATSAIPDAQVWIITNAGSDRSIPLNEMRDQAVAGLDETLGIFEWSAPENASPTDVEALAMANPSLGRGRITIDSLLGKAARAQAAGGKQLAGFLTEYMCKHVPLLSPAIDIEAWESCKDGGNLDHLRDRVALCLDVSLDEMHATVYAAAVDGDKVRVDVVSAWEGRNAIRDMSNELPGLVAKVKPKAFGWFPYGPAAVATAALAERPGWPPQGVKVEPIRGNVAAVCMGFAEQVRSQSIAHSGDPLLDAHVRAAEKLVHGDGWRFTRKGAGQVDAAYAAAGAVHLARTIPERYGWVVR